MSHAPHTHTWEKTKLGKYFKIKHGYAFKSAFFSDKGSLLVLTPGNFKADGGLKFDGRQKFYSGDFPEDFLLKRGDFLVVMTDLTQNAPILGSPAFIPEENKYLHNQRLGKVVDLDESHLDSTFLFYLLNTREVRGQIKGTATGATVKHTAPDRIYTVEVSIPPLPTQHKIAAFLSAYDDLIENNTRRIKILEEMAQSIYREWFVNFRFPGHTKVKMLESELGKIPEGWNVKTLGEVAENFDSKRVPLSSLQRAQMKGQYPYYGAAKILDHVNDYIFDGKYLLVAEDGSVITHDNTPVLQFVDAKFWANNHTHVLRGKSPVSTEFIYLLLSNFSILGHITGAAQPKITQANLNRIPVIVPPIPVLEQFNEIVGMIMKSTVVLSRKNGNLRQTRDLLLPKLISGQIDVSDLDIKTEVPA